MKLKRRFGVVLLMAMLVMAMTVTASAAKKVKLNKKSATLSIGKTVTLRVKNAGKKKVTWASSDVYVATVDDGVVTAVDAGTATIRATVGAKTLKCKVTVKAAAEQASVAIVGYSSFEPRLVLTGSAASASALDNTQALDVLSGKTQYDLKPHVQTNPAGAALTWTSSNEKVATVKDGVVKAVADGTALITVSANGASDSIVCFVSGMGSDENSNPVVITMANYDRLFNKFFEKVTVRTVWLDVNGNIMDPNFENAWVISKDNEKVPLTNYVRKWFYHEEYYMVCKDPRVDTLKSSGEGNFLVWETVNDLAANGGNPVLTEKKRLGLVNPIDVRDYSIATVTQYFDENGHYTGYSTTSSVSDNGSVKLGTVHIPVGGDIPFKYNKKVYDPETGLIGRLENGQLVPNFEAAGRVHIVVSDPAVADKNVLGFGPYGYSEEPQPIVTYSDKKNKIINKVAYETNAFVDETFREIRFVLYLK